jgi:hypothetical protein
MASRSGAGVSSAGAPVVIYRPKPMSLSDRSFTEEGRRYCAMLPSLIWNQLKQDIKTKSYSPQDSCCLVVLWFWPPSPSVVGRMHGI